MCFKRMLMFVKWFDHNNDNNDNDNNNDNNDNNDNPYFLIDDFDVDIDILKMKNDFNFRFPI